MPVNPNDVKQQNLIDLFNKIEAKINEVITDSESGTDPLDLSEE